MMEQLCSTKMVTPAFVVLEHGLADRLNRIRQFCDEIGLSLLFSLKSFALVDGLKAISRSVNGFSCSSLFEARLARSVLSRPKTVHLVAPYLTEESTDEMVQICDFVSLNSIGRGRRNCTGVRLRERNGCIVNSVIGMSLNKPTSTAA